MMIRVIRIAGWSELVKRRPGGFAEGSASQQTRSLPRKASGIAAQTHSVSIPRSR